MPEEIALNTKDTYPPIQLKVLIILRLLLASPEAHRCHYPRILSNVVGVATRDTSVQSAVELCLTSIKLTVCLKYSAKTHLDSLKLNVPRRNRSIHKPDLPDRPPKNWSDPTNQKKQKTEHR